MKQIVPNSTLIENVAANFAAEWFEAGLHTPNMNMLREKYNNDPRKFARLNFEKFIPKAVEILIEMLKPTSNCSPEMREEIYDALMERVTDPRTLTSTDLAALPDIDVKKVLDNAENLKVDDIVTQLLNPPKPKPLVIHNPGKATRQ